MNQYLYTVTEAAELLKLHPKTLRRKIQSGEIEATKLGKQYRITQAQLEAFCGSDIDARPGSGVVSSRRMLVATVVDIYAISQEEGSRLVNYLLASQKNPREQQSRSPLRIDSIYEPEVGFLKIFLSGDSEDIRALLKLIESLGTSDIKSI